MPRPWKGAILIGDVIRRRMPLWATCRACGHRARVDPGGVADRVGYDMPVPSLSPKMRCTRCGVRRAAVTLGDESRDGRR
jgi:hypothetical protein